MRCDLISLVDRNRRNKTKRIESPYNNYNQPVSASNL